MSTTVVDLADVDRIVSETGRGRENVIPILRRIQQKYNWLPEAALKRVCEISEITPSQIVGVSTFYHKFRHKPAGKHFVNVCVGTACHVKGAELIIDGVRLSQGIPADQDTDPQGEFTLCKVFWSVLGDDKQRARTHGALQRARGFVHQQLGVTLHTRTVPRLEYVFDESIAGVARMQQALLDLKREREARTGPDTPGPLPEAPPGTPAD